MYKKLISLLLAGITIFILSLPVFAETDEDATALSEPDLSKVTYAYAINLENEKVLISKNPKAQTSPASTAKIMTGLIACERFYGKYDDKITVTEESLGKPLGKSISLKAGEEVFVKDLLYAVICYGANDAANVVAYEIAGSQDAFVELMNNRAKNLGMKDTVYSNPSGFYSPEMVTTAYDTMLLAKAAYFNNIYMEICNSIYYTMLKTNLHKERYIYNSNCLIATNIERKYRNKDAIGMNSGSTTQDGYVLVSAANKNGCTNLFVVLGADSDEDNIYSYYAVSDMIKWSFDNFGYVKIIDKGEMITEIKVNLSGSVDHVVLSPEQNLEIFLPLNIDIPTEITRKQEMYCESLNAPVEAGQSAGKISFEYQGEIIGEVELVSKNNVARNDFLYILSRIKAVTSDKKFRLAVFFTVVIVIVYVALSVYKKIRKRMAQNDLYRRK